VHRLLLVANPAASGFTSSLHRDTTEILGRSFSVTTIWPDGPQEARAESATAAADGFDVVVAMGGDGVVHQVANGIIGSATAIGVVPAGTTNVFGRLAGFPTKPRDAAEAIADATATTPMSVLRLTEGDRDTRTHIATFAAGIGFDAEVILESERKPLRKIGFGALHYARSVAKVAVSDYRGRLATLHVGDGTRTAHAVAVQFQVQQEFTYLSRLPLRLSSGPTPIATVLARISGLQMTYAVLRAALRRSVGRVPGIQVWEGFERIEVAADPAAWLEADGEVLGKTSMVVAEPDPRQLLVVGT
jgi:diacylglycerol kinase family enzyme